jgi:hypothetical protein
MATPEARVKNAINKVLASYPESYVFMPVPYGYGTSTVDYLVCHYGLFIGIEAKAPGGKPTTRQRMILGQIERAGGEAFIIDSVDKCHHLRVFLEQVKQNAASTSQPQASDGGGAPHGTDPKPFPNRKEYLARWWAAHSATASPDRDVFVEKDGVRRPEPDPDALHLDGSDPVRVTKSNVSYVNARTARVRPKRDGDGQD